MGEAFAFDLGLEQPRHEILGRGVGLGPLANLVVHVGCKLRVQVAEPAACTSLGLARQQLVGPAGEAVDVGFGNSDRAGDHRARERPREARAEIDLAMSACGLEGVFEQPGRRLAHEGLELRRVVEREHRVQDLPDQTVARLRNRRDHRLFFG